MATIATGRDTLEAQIAALASEQREITVRLDRVLVLLESRFGPRDDADRHLLVAVRESIADRPFTAKQLVRHSTADPALRDALIAADCGDDARALGALLRRMCGTRIEGGLYVDRVGTCRAGTLWRVRL
ncbi:MAG TPA: hypothetical protein VGF24_33155 [Vicinamibacterales bacterium]